jgi:hypothetical protein
MFRWERISLLSLNQRSQRYAAFLPRMIVCE